MYECECVNRSVSACMAECENVQKCVSECVNAWMTECKSVQKFVNMNVCVI